MFQLIDRLPVELADETAITASLRAWRRIEDGLGTVSSREESLPLLPALPLASFLTSRHEDIFALRGAWKGVLRIAERRGPLRRLFENRNVCSGEFFFTSQRLYFWAADLTRGFAVDYEDVLLHALQRGNGVEGSGAEGSVTLRTSLYMQLAVSNFDSDSAPESESGDPDNADDTEADDEDEDDESEEEQFAELVFVPEGNANDELAVVEEMFLALSDCSALHPSLDGESSTSENGSDSDSDSDSELDEETLDGNGEPIASAKDASKRAKLVDPQKEPSSSPQGSR
jgi:hypothetical protein